MYQSNAQIMSLEDFLTAIDATLKGKDRWQLKILATQATTAQRKRLCRIADNAIIAAKDGSILARPLREEYRRIRMEILLSEAC